MSKTAAKKFIALCAVTAALTAAVFFAACESEYEHPFSVTLSVTCTAAVGHADLPETVRALLPADGVILSDESIEITKKTSVLTLLRENLQQQRIQFDISGGYVRAINNLYEKQCGPFSGWVYYINGSLASSGASSYAVRADDVIEWRYVLSAPEFGA
ncbi:MAG: DUF4430 domain-containing protein [Firmicutes bacterium]|nr:DUF4430 domain-containing protein [Bacillota bacterium]